MENISQLENLLNTRLKIKSYLYTNQQKNKCYIAIDGKQTYYRSWEATYDQFNILKNYLKETGVEYHTEWNTVENEPVLSIYINDMSTLIGLLRLI